MNHAPMPLPGRLFDGRTVVASSWVDDKEYAMIMLDRDPPFFRIVRVEANTRDIVWAQKAESIGHAFFHYGDCGGDVEGER